MTKRAAVAGARQYVDEFGTPYGRVDIFIFKDNTYILTIPYFPRLESAGVRMGGLSRIERRRLDEMVDALLPED